MLDYAIKLTVDPGGMNSGDVDALRDAGFGDQAILDVCQVISYYNYVNRLADGLGVELEDHWDGMEHTLTREEFDALRRARQASPPGSAPARRDDSAGREDPAA